MSDNSSSRRRGVLNHWVPLVVTVAVATAGVAAWAWSQRHTEDDESEHNGLDYGDANPPPRGGPRGGGAGAGAPGNPSYAEVARDEKTEGREETGVDQGGHTSWGARMAGALRRTPSPQQMFGSAGKTVAAGVAAAGAAVGTALTAIREEDKAAFADHETWSEEADAKKERAETGGDRGAPQQQEQQEQPTQPTQQQQQPKPQAKSAVKHRRTVAIVVSAETPADQLDSDFEHVTVLSHIPKHIDHARTKLFILIYAPGLTDTPILDTTAQPGEGPKSPVVNPASGGAAFNAVYSQALALVEKDTMVLPFTSRNGHAHILRHIQPETVYLQESLAGDAGSVVTQLQTWLRHEIVLVVGAESGHGGLADSESEAETKDQDGKAEEKWWQREDRVGRGRGVVVVDSMRVHDDWARRVQGSE